MRFKTQPLRLERKRSPTGERVVERGQRVTVEQLRRAWVIGMLGASPTPALPDLVARPLQHLLVGSVLPQHQFLDEPEQTLAFELRRHVAQRLPIGRTTQSPGGTTGRHLPHPSLRAAGGRRNAGGRYAARQALLQCSLRGALRRRVRQQHVDVLRRVVDHLREDHRARRRQRPASPPQMQR